MKNLIAAIPMRRRDFLALAGAGAAGLLSRRLCAAEDDPTRRKPDPGHKGGRDRGGRPKGGPTNTFYTDVPEHPFDIILARPTRNSVTLSVLAYEDMDGYFVYGTRKGSPRGRTAAIQFKKGRPVAVVVDSLRPDTQYYYQFRYRDPGSAQYSAGDGYFFHTQRSPGSAFTFTVQADSHLDSNTDTELYTMTLANALADKPDFHIDLGDTFMTGKYGRDHKDALKQYLAQRYYFGLLCHSAPLFFVLGNHDGEHGGRRGGAADNVSVWSCNTRKLYFPNPVPDGFYTGNDSEGESVGLLENYYTWEWGNALFVVLDPFLYPARGSRRGDDGWSRSLGERQYRWLKKTLEESKATFKFVFIHHLVGGADRQGRGGIEAAKYFEWGGYNKDGSYGFDEKRPDWGQPIHELLVDGNVSIVFHGHDHFYAKQELDGIVYQLVPQPGHPGHGVPRMAQDYGYTHGDFLSSSGHMRVTVSEDKVTADYVRSYLPADEGGGRKNGEVDHSYTINARKKNERRRTS